MGYYGYGYGMDWGYMGAWGWVFMVIFWLFVIVGFMSLIQGGMHGAGRRHSPLEILKERYAKGEIDKKEFESMKKEIQ